MTPPRFTLQRLEHSDYATYGTLSDAENKTVCVVLELPWKGNAHNVSCIPPGTYRANRRKSPKRGYELFELVGVPGRSHIEIHVGNTPDDSQGCLLVGSAFGLVGEHHGIVESRKAFAKWMGLLAGVQTITLDVKAPVQVASA